MLRARRAGDRLRAPASKAAATAAWSSPAPPRRRRIFSPRAPASSSCIRSPAWRDGRSRSSTSTARSSKLGIPRAGEPGAAVPRHPRPDPRGRARPSCRRAHRGRYLRDGGPPQLDRRVLQDLRAAARLAVAVHAPGGEAVRNRYGHVARDRAGAQRRSQRRDGAGHVRPGHDAPQCRRWAWACRPRRSMQAIGAIDRLRRAAPRLLICHYDPRRRHGVPTSWTAIVSLCEQTGAQCVLEMVVESVEDYAAELEGAGLLVREAGLPLAGMAVCPVGDLKAVLPGRAAAAGSAPRSSVCRGARGIPGRARWEAACSRSSPSSTASGRRRELLDFVITRRARSCTRPTTAP